MTQTNQAEVACDVAIIGGGPGGSTTGTLLKKYNPAIKVCIFEKEQFPREHIGESQLPPISDVLEEMGCWDKVEAANFPIKVGATFRWGKNPELWDFEFLPLKDFKDEPRPAKYVGQRRQTAFQVERSIYDDILLKHAREMGCEVYEQTQVGEIERPLEGDRVAGLVLRDGRRVTARWYIDASGHSGILRRAMGVQIDLATKLQNIAIWDYWDNAEWAVEIGVGGTRIQVMSQPNGWMWFIPIGPTRASLGFVCPAEYFKNSGKSVTTLYQEAIARDERIARLISQGVPSGEIRTTKDWSFVSERCFGENWFLVGEAAGFADPILSAGLTLTHTGARELAYTILELDRRDSEHDPGWLKSVYCQTQRARVRQHIQFADYWYAANGQLTDLKEHCASIARASGMPMAPDAAWRWIARGGFSNDALGQPMIGGFDVAGVKGTIQFLSARPMKWMASEYNVFKLNLAGATEIDAPAYVNGTIDKVPCYRRGSRVLPLTGAFRTVVDTLHQTSDIAEILRILGHSSQDRTHAARAGFERALQCLEVMLAEEWVVGKLDRKKPRLNLATPDARESDRDVLRARGLHLHDPAEEQ
jgi:flavin-dependent dehydrogenase